MHTRQDQGGPGPQAGALVLISSVAQPPRETRMLVTGALPEDSLGLTTTQ